MADRIRVEIQRYEALSGQLKALASSMSAVEGELRAIRIDRISGAEVKVHLPSGRLNTVSCTLRSGDAAGCLRSLAAGLSRLDEQVGALSRGVQQAGDCFENNEKQLVREFESLATPTSIYQDVSTIMGYSPDRSTWSPSMHSAFREAVKDLKIRTEDGVTLVTTAVSGMLYVGNQLIGAFTKGYDVACSATETSYNGWGPRFSISNKRTPLCASSGADVDQNGFEWDKLGVMATQGETKLDLALWGYGDDGELGKLKTNYDIGFGNVELYEKDAIGFGLYKQKDGSIKPTFGFDVEAGASVSVAEMNETAKYELCDSVDLVADGKASFLQAGAEGKAGIGIIDGKPTVALGGRAEANVAKGELDLKLDNEWVDGTIGGTLSYGVSAVFDMGFQDGKWTYEVGGGCGPCVTVKGEIDYSDTINKVYEALTPHIEYYASQCAWIG